MSNTSIKPLQVDMAKAAMILNLLTDDAATASYITATLLNGLSLRILREVGRSDDEILLSTEMTLDNINGQLQENVQPTAG